MTSGGVLTTPLHEVFTLSGEGGGTRTQVSYASGTATLPMSY
jgi:hypothetical protein